MPIWSQVQTFYNGINAQTRNNVDAAAGGALLNKTQEQAYELLEEMAANNSQWTNERNQHPRRAMAVSESDKLANLTAQIANLTKQLGSMSSNNSNTNSVASASFACCENCGENHDSASCQVGNPFAQSQDVNEVNYVGNFQRQANNPYSNTYNPGWRNHPNFSWRENANQSNQPRGQIHILQGPAQQFKNQSFQNPAPIQSSNQHSNLAALEQSLLKMSENTNSFMQETRAAIKGLETQVGQLAQAFQRSQGTLPSQTEKNPKEQVLSVNLVKD